MAIQEAAKPALSRREREVAALVAEGLTNREIARRLFVSERTVDAHLEHIREKLAVNSRAQVATWFVTQSQTAGEAVPVPLVRPRRVVPIRVAAAAATLVVVALGGIVVWTRQSSPELPAGPIITTIAGTRSTTGFGGYTGDNGPATSAQLTYPWSVAFGPAGFFYIGDNGASAIRRVDSNGTITTLAGGVTVPFREGGYGPETGIGSINSIAVAPDGQVYFANGRFVGRVDANYSVHLVPTGAMRTPSFLSFARDGTLYVSDTFADQVWKRDPDGTLSLFVGSGAHGFDGDNGAASGAKLSYPAGLAVDTAGNLYIAEPGNNRIRRVDTATHVITTIAGSSDTYGFGGDGGPADRAQLNLPHGVAVAINGDVYIAGTGNNRIRRVDAKTRVITTVAGTGRAAFGGEGGAASRADIYGPISVAVDSLNVLYIVDTGNHRVRMMHLSSSQ